MYTALYNSHTNMGTPHTTHGPHTCIYAYYTHMYEDRTSFLQDPVPQVPFAQACGPMTESILPLLIWSLHLALGGILGCRTNARLHPSLGYENGNVNWAPGCILDISIQPRRSLQGSELDLEVLHPSLCFPQDKRLD